MTKLKKSKINITSIIQVISLLIVYILSKYPNQIQYQNISDKTSPIIDFQTEIFNPEKIWDTLHRNKIL